MKRIKVKVVPNAKKIRIVDEPGLLKVYINAPAAEGKANKALIDTLAGHFKVKKRDIRIVSGERNREKILEIGL